MLKSLNAKVKDIHHGERFDIIAANLFSDISRKKIKHIIDAGGAYVNKKRVMFAKHLLKTGDKIELFWEEKTQDIPNAPKLSLLIHENAAFYVINKPAGIPTQATLSSATDTILHYLCKLDPKKFNLKNMHLVHRLDKYTSGILLVAKTKEAQKNLEALFMVKQVQKTYDALCFSAPKQNQGTINFPIARDKNRHNCFYAVTNKANVQDAKSAETSYQVTKVFNNGEASHITCYPKTGRTHQIRVHLSTIGVPVLGDLTYAQNIYGHRHSQIATRHMLHASKINFTLDNETFEFTAAFPEDFTRTLAALEKTN